METNPKNYTSPGEWLKNNRPALAPYAGEWIAFTRSGVIVHHPDGHIVIQQARQTGQDYALEYVHPLEVSRIVRIVPIRIRSLKNNTWQPDYTLSIRTSTAGETLWAKVELERRATGIEH